MSTSERPLRALFLNENLGGHATMHRHLRGALTEHPEVDARFVDLPPPRLPRRLFAAPVPRRRRPARAFPPHRVPRAGSFVARRLLRRPGEPFDVLHVYTHNAAL